MGCAPSSGKLQNQDTIVITANKAMNAKAKEIQKEQKNFTGKDKKDRQQQAQQHSADTFIAAEPNADGKFEMINKYNGQEQRIPLVPDQVKSKDEGRPALGFQAAADQIDRKMAQDAADDDTSDEEWNTMANRKTLKKRVGKGLQNKLKLKLLAEAGAEDEDETDSEELDSDDDFYVEPPEFGDQFMACKPWLGAIKEPDIVPPINPTIPDERFEVDFVHGYKSDLTRQNLLYNAMGQCVYMTAALGIILDKDSWTQKIFGGGEETVQRRKQQTKGEFGHSDDIVSLAMNADRTLVATGQVGLEPMIFVWNAETAERVHLMTLPKGSRSVSALGFSSDGNYISAADMSDDHNVHLFDLLQTDKKGKCLHLGSVKKDRKKVFQIMWSPTNAGSFVSVGLEHIFFWNVSPKLTAKKASPMPQASKKGGKLGFPSVAFSKTGNAYLAGSDGTVYSFNSGGAKSKVFPKTHAKMISAIKVVPHPQDPSKELMITGGSDNKINVFVLAGNAITPVVSCGVTSTPRSVDFMGTNVLAGLSDGRILELENVLSSPQGPQIKTLIRSHYDGEAWGLAMVDIPDKVLYFTSGDDNLILLYDGLAKKCIGEGRVSTVDDIKTLPPKKKRGGASSMSNQHPHQQARALAYLECYNHLVVGHNDGAVSIRQVTDLANLAEGAEVDLNTVTSKANHPKEWIEIMRFNSDGSRLAVGSHDNFIYVYNTSEDGKYKPWGKLKGHSSYITSLDWSLDGDFIRSSCGAYELLFFDPESKKQIPGGASATTSTQWTNHTVKFGWYVDGIYPSGTDGTHINIVEMSKTQQLIATGDDYGLVNVYRSPCREDHKARSYRGHSEHVTNIKIYGDEAATMCSLGGQDQTLIQWKLV